MIHDRLIVCIASSWDYDPTSKHHVMKNLSRENHVLWVNYHGSRSPELTRWDMRDSIRAVLRVAKGLQQVTPRLWQMTPMVIPGATSGLMGRIHQRVLIDQIERAIGAIDPARRLPVQIWTFAPDVGFLRDSLDEESLVYYCVDEYTKFQGFDPKTMTELETRLIQDADTVIATSRPLWEAKRKIRPDVALVPHGVDFDHFSRSWRARLTAPIDLSDMGKPVFGFFGLIHHWFDVELMAKVASLRPKYSFALIGDCKVDPAALLQQSNIRMLGRRSFAELPQYCAGFVAGLLPFVRNDMTRCINPIKLTEYLAAGLPVISTAIPAAEEFGEAVAIAHTPEEFASACDAALQYTSADRSRISELVREHTWESRVRVLSELVSSRARVKRPKEREFAGAQWTPAVV